MNYNLFSNIPITAILVSKFFVISMKRGYLNIYTKINLKNLKLTSIIYFFSLEILEGVWIDTENITNEEIDKSEKNKISGDISWQNIIISRSEDHYHEESFSQLMPKKCTK